MARRACLISASWTLSFFSGSKKDPPGRSYSSSRARRCAGTRRSRSPTPRSRWASRWITEAADLSRMTRPPAQPTITTISSAAAAAPPAKRARSTHPALRPDAAFAHSISAARALGRLVACADRRVHSTKDRASAATSRHPQVGRVRVRERERFRSIWVRERAQGYFGLLIFFFFYRSISFIRWKIETDGKRHLHFGKAVVKRTFGVKNAIGPQNWW